MTTEETRPDELLIENEFARVSISVRPFGNGQRLMIRDLRTGQCLLLDPLELEGLAWAEVADLHQFVNPSIMRRWHDEPAPGSGPDGNGSGD